MTDRERLAAIIGARQHNAKAEQIADALLAEGVTLPPEPPQPVTSEVALEGFIAAVRLITDDDGWFSLCSLEDKTHFRHALDTIRDRYATDHGLLTREEVERRAREWAATYTQGCFPTNSLLETLLRREVPRG